MREKIKLQKFVDELPIPNTLSPKMRSNYSSYYEVTMKEFSQKLHRDLGPTRLWGYDGTFPGPTFDVRKNETVFVKWINDLPNKHFLPVDTTIHGSEITLPEGRSVVHLHWGAHGMQHCGKVIIVGGNAKAVRRLGFTPASTLNDALEMASDVVGRSPTITHIKTPPLMVADVV